MTSRFFRYLARALLALIVLVAIVVAAGTIYLRTESFSRLLRSEVNHFGATSFRGQLVIGQIDTSFWGGLTIHDLRVQYRGARVMLIPRLQISYSLIPSLWREMRLKITAINPMIRLERDGEGKWNLADALALTTPSTGTSSAFTVSLDAIAINNAIVEIALQGARGGLYRLDQANLEARMLILPTELKVQLSNLRSHVARSGKSGMGQRRRFVPE
jgi:uncharacterized protein involved in outer membrane biogenesis